MPQALGHGQFGVALTDAGLRVASTSPSEAGERKHAASEAGASRHAEVDHAVPDAPGLLRCMAEHLQRYPKCKTVALFIPHFYKMHGGRSREADMKGMQANAFLQRFGSEIFELTARPPSSLLPRPALPSTSQY